MSEVEYISTILERHWLFNDRSRVRSKMDAMSNEELLKAATEELGFAIDAKYYEASGIGAQISIAASLLVIAREMSRVEINQVVNEPEETA